MPTALFHPRMLPGLANFYNSTVAIQSATITRDTDGAELKAWANVAGMAALACNISAAAPGTIWEQATRQSEKTEVTVTHQVSLRGYYPTIETAMRANDGGVYYEILAVEHDSQHASTRLKVQRLEPETAEMV